jgi:peptidyl-prolyl cis-trans isomerase B (cyclophilin B)
MPAGRSYERRLRAKRDAARAARKRAERMRKLRIALSITGAVALALVLFLVFKPGKSKPVAQPSATPTPSPTSSLITGCSLPSPAPTPNGKQFPAPPALTIDTSKLYVATFQTTCGTVKMRMDPKASPRTVNNFVFLARQGYYDGTFFHRVQNIPSDYAIVQGGDQKGDGTGSPGYSYTGETPPPGTKYLRGFVAMANSGSLASSGSQFFFVVHSWASLPASYAILGKVDDATSFATLERMVTAIGSDLGNGLGIAPNPHIYILKVTIEELKRG